MAKGASEGKYLHLGVREDGLGYSQGTDAAARPQDRWFGGDSRAPDLWDISAALGPHTGGHQVAMLVPALGTPRQVRLKKKGSPKTKHALPRGLSLSGLN